MAQIDYTDRQTVNLAPEYISDGDMGIEPQRHHGEITSPATTQFFVEAQHNTSKSDDGRPKARPRAGAGNPGELDTNLTIRILNDYAIAQALSEFDETPKDPESNGPTQKIQQPDSKPSVVNDLEPREVKHAHSLMKPVAAQSTLDPVQPKPIAPQPSFESSDDIRQRLANEFSPIIQPAWDTLIYIGAPAQEPEQSDTEYNEIKRHFAKPYLLSSATLKATGSTEFPRLLGSMSARAQRKLRNLNVHLNLPGGAQPKYYIDLRPPQVDDDAVILLTEMSCPGEVLSWHHNARDLGVDRMIVGGIDNLDVSHRTFGLPSDKPPATNMSEQAAYSPLRHHLAIERLLYAICEQQPNLDSAPKVWSFVAIAKYLDCGRHPRVSTEIYSWLFAGRNSEFVQHNPQATYRIATALQLPDLARVSYSLLVSQRALLLAEDQAPAYVTDLRPKLRRGSTCHLDDDEINRIDHAAHAFSNRVYNIFTKIVNEPMSWMVGSVEVLKLFALGVSNEDDHQILVTAWRILREYVRGEILQAATQNLQGSLFFHRAKLLSADRYETLRSKQFITQQYNNLSLHQRLMTVAFWENLSTYGFLQDKDNVDAWFEGHVLQGLEDLVPDLGKLGLVDGDVASESPPSYVPKQDLYDVLADVNIMISNREAIYADLPMDPMRRAKFQLSCNDIRAAAYKNLESGQFTPLGGPAGTDGNTADTHHELAQAMQRLRPDNEVEEPRRPDTFHDTLPESMRLLREAPIQYRWDDYTEIRMANVFKMSFGTMFAEILAELRCVIEKEILYLGWANDEIGVENEIPIYDFNTLLNINGNETRYLPLWAGGFDDGSGGVFNDTDVPNMLVEEGFRGGKRGLHEGLDHLDDIEMGEAGYSVAGDSEFDEIRTEEGVSTIGRASRIATDGSNTVASTVISMDE